jgi:hypothetical protein
MCSRTLCTSYPCACDPTVSTALLPPTPLVLVHQKPPVLQVVDSDVVHTDVDDTAAPAKAPLPEPSAVEDFPAIQSEGEPHLASPQCAGGTALSSGWEQATSRQAESLGALSAELSGSALSSPRSPWAASDAQGWLDGSHLEPVPERMTEDGEVELERGAGAGDVSGSRAGQGGGAEPTEALPRAQKMAWRPRRRRPRVATARLRAAVLRAHPDLTDVDQALKRFLAHSSGMRKYLHKTKRWF